MVVNDALDMSGMTIYFKQDECGVRRTAGADMLLKPADPARSRAACARR